MKVAALYTQEPRRRLDLMLSGALIEARSCERFALLSSRLPAPLGEFYADLERAEARHCDLYLEFAAAAAAVAGAAGNPSDWQARWVQLAAVEAELINAEDGRLRFHSGPPPDSRGSVLKSKPL